MTLSGARFSFVTPLVFLFSVSIAISYAASELQSTPISSGNDGLIAWRRSVEEVPNPLGENSSFALAVERTHRKDPLNGYKYYTGGWNISDEHYWASVGFTAIPLFAIAILWFVCFGLALLIMCCCYCCRRQRTFSYSRTCYAISLLLLILFTLAIIGGCGVMYNGQRHFYRSTLGTLDYVMGQASLTVGNLRNFSNSLSSAKNVGVEQIFLPTDVQGRIDALETKLNSTANVLATRSSSSFKKSHNVLDSVQWELIILAAVMLVLAVLGLLLSVLGLQVLVYILVVVGWIIVTGLFILAGVSLLIHNVVADTCIATDEWLSHPHTNTAWGDILPCVEPATANEFLYRGKEVTFQLVNVVNRVLINISNVDFPPILKPPLNYNQSGPLMPPLCNPYLPDMSDRKCLEGEVSFDNASQAWQGYICNTSVVSGSEICTTVGRLTPGLYSQMNAAVNVSHGLYLYVPFLTQLLDCTFIRESFTEISRHGCPGLDRYSRMIYIGLTDVAAAALLSLIIWVVHAREGRHRRYNQQFIVRSRQPPLVGHGKT